MPECKEDAIVAPDAELTAASPEDQRCRARSHAVDIVRDSLSPVEYRTLGRTGLRLSAYGLGGMMFGSWGNPDPDGAALTNLCQQPLASDEFLPVD